MNNEENISAIEYQIKLAAAEAMSKSTQKIIKAMQTKTEQMFFRYSEAIMYQMALQARAEEYLRNFGPDFKSAGYTWGTLYA